MNSMTLSKRVSMITLLAVAWIGVAAAQSPQDPRLVRLVELADDAGCTFPQPPSIPAAEGATMEQMVETQGAIQTYMDASNELLACLEGISGDMDLSEEDRDLALAAYNSEVSNQETLAENWNVQRTRFLEMQQQ